MITVRPFTLCDVRAMQEIWNEVVAAGDAFPQEEPLSFEGAVNFFSAQTYCGVAQEDGELVGLYILHPNNVGRCGHIANASYAVKSGCRGKHIGEKLVTDCLHKCPEFGYGVLQFNAVVATNAPALALYKKLGFKPLGVIPKGFRLKDGTYADIIPHCFDISEL